MSATANRSRVSIRVSDNFVQDRGVVDRVNQSLTVLITNHHLECGCCVPLSLRWGRGWPNRNTPLPTWPKSRCECADGR